ncbi:FAD-binding oxidoreductase [Gloeothece verrucosa]|uniref:FAD linked oxidase domain protein n=1 Tax=Gloeothece verrucosa (strain PCC 7822) TaxID=497965 RepID=E0UH34_GLOV7|nr:FAD-dependent oxidoreductase [Gloeothece verrucosa]ADN15633.1 FAD linked oxidase domain protein [Gloeothece verrucosa PCC 7822]
MDYDLILKAWSQVIGSENLLTENQAIQNAQTATFPTQQQIVAILCPANREEIQQCLKIANEFSVPIYPISRGRNWGYGSRVPVQDKCALLDLSRLNRIIDFNQSLAYVTVEPGVTQQQLYQFLTENAPSLWMDCTGSSADSSLIGAIMERGFGHTPYGDRFANVCGLEVVLPSGECIHTGFTRFPNALAGSVYRWGIGPYIDGLFTQSNLGIVTKMTLWLMPAPEYFQAFYFSIEKDEQLPELINALRPLRLNGTIKSAVHIANSYKVLSTIRQYPWEETRGKTPLPTDVMDYFAQTWDLGAWNGSGGLYGSRQQVAAARQLIKKALRGKVRRLLFLDDQTLKIVQWLAKPYQLFTGLNLPELIKIVKPVFGLMKGIPTDTQIASIYWRKKSPPPQEMNPDLDQCGLMWCSPIAPLDGQHAAKIYEIVNDTLTDYQFEPIIAMTMLTERCLSCVISITYDREVAGEDQQALKCYQDLNEKLSGAGYYPYRLGIKSMQILEQAEKNYQNLLKNLKKSLDPNDILAPGRYSS